MSLDHDDLVERVAKAIGDAAARRHGRTLMAWAVSPEREDCLVFAEAAIQTIDAVRLESAPQSLRQADSEPNGVKAKS